MKYSLQWEAMPGWPYYSNDDEQFQQQWGWWENHLTNGYAVQPTPDYKCHNDPATEYNEDDEEDTEQAIMKYRYKCHDDPATEYNEKNGKDIEQAIMMNSLQRETMIMIMRRSTTSRE